MIATLVLALSVVLVGTLVVPNQGEQFMLDAATGKTATTVWTLRLFASNTTPAATDTEAQYVEATGGGYAPIALDASQWVTTPGTPAVSQYPPQTFTFTGPLTARPTVYGYYVTRADGALVYAERLSAPFTPANAGDHIDVALALSLGPLAA